MSFLDWYFSNYGPDVVQYYSQSKPSHLLVKYCIIWFRFQIVSILSNSRPFEKDITMFSQKVMFFIWIFI